MRLPDILEPSFLESLVDGGFLTQADLDSSVGDPDIPRLEYVLDLIESEGYNHISFQYKGNLYWCTASHDHYREITAAKGKAMTKREAAVRCYIDASQGR